jgi:HK97 family phage prohead protease
MTASEQRFDVPRHDLIRGLSPMRAEDDGNVMVGYPIVFNQWTEIANWEGNFLERVLPSGPTKALKETADRIKVQYDHGMHPLVGTSGLGKPRQLKRDSVGVYTETPLSDHWFNRELIKPMLVDGVLDGMSFRFSVVEDSWTYPKKPTEHNPKALPERSLVDFKWYEFGPVDHPAYQAAMAGIRSQAAFALWMQASEEERSEIMREHSIVPQDQRLIVPGWDRPAVLAAGETVVPRAGVGDPTWHLDRLAAAFRSAHKITAPTEERNESAGDDATDATESEPDGQSTRSEEEAPPEETSDYTPAQRTPLSPERRQAQKGMVAAFLAHTSKE